MRKVKISKEPVLNNSIPISSLKLVGDKNCGNWKIGEKFGDWKSGDVDVVQ